MVELYRVRCEDLDIMPKDKQQSKFVRHCYEKCINRKLNLSKLFLGPRSASLLAFWIRTEQIDITHLNLSWNNLGNNGVYNLSVSICSSRSLVSVDISQNGLTPRAASAFYDMLAMNQSLIEVNFGSIGGSYRNRFNRDFAMAFG